MHYGAHTISCVMLIFLDNYRYSFNPNPDPRLLLSGSGFSPRFDRKWPLYLYRISVFLLFLVGHFAFLDLDLQTQLVLDSARIRNTYGIKGE